MTQYPTGEALAAHITGIDAAELVHTGGQKAVYNATVEGQVVALKVIALFPEDSEDEDIDAAIGMVVERARREVSILQKVDVPVLAKRGPLGLSIVQICDSRWLHFTEEWIEGRTLRNIVREERLAPERVARLGLDLVQATCWLSSRGLVHRDIKPANVIWAVDRSRFVLLDPGIALDLYGPSLTRARVAVGTMAYLSPEQTDPQRKRSLDFRSDLFTIGVVLYEAAVAEHPFMTIDTTPSHVLAGILTGTPQPVADRVEGFPQALSDLISRLLGKAPHLRFRTCDRARLAIESIALSLGVRV